MCSSLLHTGVLSLMHTPGAMELQGAEDEEAIAGALVSFKFKFKFKFT